jgi:hypothetical protein
MHLLKIIETTRRKQRKCFMTWEWTMVFFGQNPKGTGNKSKNRQMVLYQTRKLLHSKENNQ